MLREEYNANKATHRRALKDHISRVIYIILNVMQAGLVKIIPMGVSLQKAKW